MTDDDGSADARPNEVRPAVRAHYAEIATAPGSCCGPSCCSGASAAVDPPASTALGYSLEELAVVATGTDLGLGYGNPTGLASLSPGETVVDLGSGAGLDCFLAARRVGDGGHVIGVDMTPEMIERARAAAQRGSFDGVEFRLGEIEHLPIADASVDVVLSNCVINLTADKTQVYREAFRVLRPGGRLAISDMIATRPISDEERGDTARWVSCSSGAISADATRAILAGVGFREISIEGGSAPSDGPGLARGDALGVVPMTVRARRPAE